MDILFTNATILPMTAAGDEPRTFTGAVGVAGNRIALVTASGSEADAFRTCSPGVRVIDCTGRLLMPGLVNTHCHAAMTLQRSYADDIALMEWLNDYIWPFEARQTADDVALGMTLGIVEMLLGGVTSFVDMYYHEKRCFPKWGRRWNSPPAATGSGSPSHPIRPTPCRPKTCGAARSWPANGGCIS